MIQRHWKCYHSSSRVHFMFWQKIILCLARNILNIQKQGLTWITESKNVRIKIMDYFFSHSLGSKKIQILVIAVCQFMASTSLRTSMLSLIQMPTNNLILSVTASNIFVFPHESCFLPLSYQIILRCCINKNVLLTPKAKQLF